ncbi:glycosyltransferase [Algoriphagus boritolerans]|uniref:glycosyltransferase n=1 Tax=Algoriphagus boritolerans TaxID=308111 RepID=UPI00135AA67A|nr:glycosyltransferase [Algoriphagus boritolerans]
MTQKFPFESGEEFLVPELKRLNREFDRIILIPTAVRDFSIQRATPKNVLVHKIKNPENPVEVAFLIVKHLLEFLPLVRGQLKNGVWNLGLLKYWAYHIPFALQIRNELEAFLKKEENLTFYSYWVDTNAFALSLLKLRYPQITYVVRTHGGDLYDERSSTGQIAFRKSIYEGAAAIWPISAHGEEYIGRNYPEYQRKVKLARLGSEDFGIGPLSTEDQFYQIVSCSSTIPLKRVDLIAQLMLKSELPIRWIHFGGEKEPFDQLLKTLGDGRLGLEVVWKGKVANEALMDFYSSNFVDALINLSISEGVPVSMMEAISFGIPVFANRVGGIGEIVVEDTGCLVENGLTVKELVAVFDHWIKSGKTRESAFRLGVRRFWELNFNAEVNHSGFFQKLNESPEDTQF